MTKSADNDQPDLATVKVAVSAVSLAHKEPDSDGYKKREPDVKQALGLKPDESLETIPFYKTVDNKQKIAGYVISTADRIFVAYHGTKFNSKSEVMHDLQASKSSMNFGNNECDVHTGFKTEFELSQHNMENALKSAMDKNKEASVTFTGHSLGGAVSQIAALKYTTEQDASKFSIPSKKVQNITFGSPRVFGRNAADLYKTKLGEKTLRVKLGHDPVTGLPPTNMGFHHAGKKVKISGVGHTGGTYCKNIEKTESINPKEHNDYSIAEYVAQVIKLTPQKFKQLLHSSSKMISSLKHHMRTNITPKAQGIPRKQQRGQSSGRG